MNGIIIIMAIICGSLVLLALLRFIERQIKRKQGITAAENLKGVVNEFASAFKDDDKGIGPLGPRA